MAQVSHKSTVNAPDFAIWKEISRFGRADHYLPGVVRCTVEGDGVGAQRKLTNADGSTIVERLEEVDEAAHRLSYVLLTNTPFRNCRTTMAVRDLGRDRAEVTWSATFEADGLPESEAVALPFDNNEQDSLSNPYDNTLIWVGSSNASDTYYVIVTNDSNQAHSYEYSVIDSAISF